MKLIIIGNGFDLHHGLNTSFSHFRNFLSKSDSNTDKLLLKNIDFVLKKLGKNYTADLLWNDFENLIGQYFTSGINVKVGDIDVYELSTQFTEKFYSYLVEENKKGDIEINPTIKKEFENADCILTFNYTDAYKKYLPKEIEVFHIHGQLQENNLPIIGFYYPNTKQTSSIDYLVRFSGRGFHKPALAIKQNEIDLEKQIQKFTNSWRNKFSEIVSIGYSYGKSDSHVFRIINLTILPQVKERNVPSTRVDKIPIVNFKLFKYDQKECNNIKQTITSTLQNQHKRNSIIDVYGNGFTTLKKEIIVFDQIDY